MDGYTICVIKLILRVSFCCQTANGFRVSLNTVLLGGGFLHIFEFICDLLLKRRGAILSLLTKWIIPGKV